MVVSVPLHDVIGDTSDIQCLRSEFEIRGLKVAVFKYFQPETCSKPAVIAIHGGPAFCHNYILPLKLLARHGHPIIFYDQAGCGDSTFVDDPEKTSPWLLTIEYYVEELLALIQHFGLEQYYLFGSSWGTVVAQECAVTQPVGLLGLLLDGALCDGKLYIDTQWRDRISTLPTFSQNLLRKLTDEKSFSSPAYQLLDETLGKFFTCRIIPRPDCYYHSEKRMNKAIYCKMQGESEFTLAGVLEHWSITSRLSAVNVPAIVLCGEFDTMTVECSQAIVDHIPRAQPLAMVPRAGHCKLLDEPQLCVDIMAKFLAQVETDRLKLET